MVRPKTRFLWFGVCALVLAPAACMFDLPPVGSTGSGTATGSGTGSGTAGSGGGGGMPCDEGFGDCNGNPLDGCETDLSTDAEHCGSCGRNCLDCGGTTCQQGQCHPEVLASAAEEPGQLILHEGYVYWTVGVDSIRRVPTAGGTANLVVSGQGSLDRFAMDETSIFWTGNYVGAPVKWMPLGGGGVITMVAEPAGTPRDIAVDDTYVYWTGSGPDLMTVTKVGYTTAEVELSPPLNLGYRLLLDGDDAYMLDFSYSVVRVSLSSGSTTELAQAELPRGIAMDGDTVYWTEEGPILGSGDRGKVSAVPKAGGAVIEIATAQDYPWAVAVDDSHVYWVNQAAPERPGTVMKAPKQGGPLTTLATHQQSPCDIAVDASCVYWTNCGSTTVMRTTK